MTAPLARSRLLARLALVASVLVAACGRAAIDPYAPPIAAVVEHGVAVRVIDATTREPLDGAIVTLVDEEALRQRGQRALEEDWRGALALAGRSWRTDGSGNATLPFDRTPRELFACGDGKWGRARLEPGARTPVEVAVAPSRALVVRVVDAKKHPVPGATVLLEGPNAGIVFDCWRALTDANGEATIAPIGLHRTEPASTIEVSIAGESSTRVEVDLSKPAERPIELVSAGVGRVELQLRDGAYELVDLDAIGLVRRFERASSRGNLFLGPHCTVPTDLGNGSDTRAVVNFEHGRALLSAIPLGGSLEVDVWWGERKLAEGLVDGPATPGETRSAVITVAEPPPLLPIDGRAVTKDGVVRDCTLAVVLEGGLRSEFERRRLPPIRTDRDGHFTLPFREFVSPEPSTLHLYAYDDDGLLELEGSFDVPPPDAPSVRDVHFGPAPLLVAGLAVDERGEPVAGASALVRVAIAKPGARPGFELVLMHELATVTGEDGRFRLHGRVPDGQSAVKLSEGHHTDSPWMEFTPGMATLLQQLPRRGGIAGRVLLPRDVPASAINVGLHRSRDVVMAQFEETRLELRDDGSFEQDDLQLGPRTLTVWLDEVSGFTLLSEIADVEIAAETTNRDPRLAAIDLRDVLHVHRVEFVDERGKPLPKVLVTEREQGDDSRRFRREAGPEGLTLVASRSFPELVAHAVGCRLERFTPSGPSTRVVMRPGFPLRFEIDPATPLPDASYALGVVVTSRDDPAAEPGLTSHELLPDLASPELRLGAGHPVSWIASTAGPHTLTLVLLQCDPQSGEWFELASRDQTFDVEARPDVQVHSLQLGPWLQEEIRAQQQDEELDDPDAPDDE